MKSLRYICSTLAMGATLVLCFSCSQLDEPLENEQIAEETDYTRTENMTLMLHGAYAELYDMQWETYPLIAVRGDDVNAAGDQDPLIQTDAFRYDRNFWVYNSVWLNLYSDILYWYGAMEEIQKYQEAGAPANTAQQYIGEIKVMQAFELLHLARLWGNILIPTSSQPSALFDAQVSSFAEVMQYISTLMDEAVPSLPDLRPNQRGDVRGGVTRYTALAIKAMANLEIENYQAVADATGEIINSGLFRLEEDYYQLFKIPGKLNDENLFEFQYSDYGTGTGTANTFNFSVYGPASWTPARAGSSGGWGFFEPTAKYIKFMLDRGEQKRLQASVLFTPDGISQIQEDPNYAELPDWVSNQTPEGDVFNNHPRYRFLSGKHYLPSTQLTPGRTTYGENKNLIAIRYAEVLLMHAEALVNGASSQVSADDAVNEVRRRAGLPELSGVTRQDVLNEKFAEFGMEWGIRFYDLARYDDADQLTHDGKTYQPEAHRFIPYPLPQLDILPQLREVQ